MATKLLLIEDVLGLGRKGDLVQAKPGYVRNFLVPQKLAVIADKRALGMQLRLQEERQKKAVEDRREAELQAALLKDKSITTFVKVAHDGHMYGSVSATDVADLLLAQHGISLDKHAVQLKHAVKKTGVSEVTLKLPEGITVLITLKVYPEGYVETESEEASVEAQSTDADQEGSS